MTEFSHRSQPFPTVPGTLRNAIVPGVPNRSPYYVGGERWERERGNSRVACGSRTPRNLVPMPGLWGGRGVVERGYAFALCKLSLCLWFATSSITQKSTFMRSRVMRRGMVWRSHKMMSARLILKAWHDWPELLRKRKLVCNWIKRDSGVRAGPREPLLQSAFLPSQYTCSASSALQFGDCSTDQCLGDGGWHAIAKRLASGSRGRFAHLPCGFSLNSGTVWKYQIGTGPELSRLRMAMPC